MRNGRQILGSAVCAAIMPLAVASMGSARPAAATASAWATNPQSTVRLISADRVAPRQGELRLGIQFRLAPRWHVYWKNSGDAGFAPLVSFSPRPGLAAAQLLWPAPHRYELPGDLEAFGYAGEVVYPVKAALAAAGEGATLRLTADVDYLVCEVDCVPHRYQLTIDQPLGDRAEPDPETAPLLERWFDELPVDANRQPGVQALARLSAATPAKPAAATPAKPAAAGSPATQGSQSAPELRFELRLRGVIAAAGGADLFFETHPALEPGRPRARQAADGLTFEVPLRRKDSSAPLPAVTELAWTATGLVQDGRPLALAARQRLPLAAAPEPSRAVGGRPAVADLPPDSGLRGGLAAADPRPVALAAMAAALLALERWGLLRRRSTPAPGRVAIGFLVLLLTVASLYALSLEISVEGLAGVELALLGSALFAWLRRRAEPGLVARALLATGLAACVVAAPWLAGNSRRPYSGSRSPLAYQAAEPPSPAIARAPS